MDILAIDLHIHSSYSDGLKSPQQIIELAYTKKLCAIAITDHDSVDGVEEAIESAKRLNIEVIPGVELSTRLGYYDIHIIGYYIDYKNGKLIDWLNIFKNGRLERAKKMIEKLKSLGICIEFSRVLELAKDGSIGRPHFAQALVENGYAKDIQDSFNKFLAADKPAFVQRPKLTPQEAFRLILDIGGVPVLAHPATLNHDTLIPQLKEQGLTGIEVWHCKHTPQDVDRYKQLAKKLALLITGGSDYHGNLGSWEVPIGGIPVPFTVLEELKRHRCVNNK